MELKTLKDLECLDADHPELCGNDHTYSGKELKAEAIKLWKHKKETFETFTGIDWCKFFNITEDDLK